MGDNNMFYVFLAILFIAFIIITVTKKQKSPKSKGESGENAVSKVLGDTIDGEKYVINDLLFETEPGKSCQIDHILINQRGIWVIETKNYAGKIYGQDNQREWIQTMAYGHEKNKFYNPVKQNSTHIYQLSQKLNVKNVFNNLVIFLPRADISDVNSEYVYSIKVLPELVSKETGIFLSSEKMEYFYKRLIDLKNTNTVSKNEHIENIYKMQEQIEQGICPRCGGKLVLRESKNGLFYGCSNYPKCKFKKNY